MNGSSILLTLSKHELITLIQTVMGFDERVQNFVVGFVHHLLNGNRVEKLHQENQQLRHQLHQLKQQHQEQINIEENEEGGNNDDAVDELPESWDQGLDTLSADSHRIEENDQKEEEERENDDDDAVDVLPESWDQGLDALSADSDRLANALGYLASASHAREHFQQNTAEIQSQLDDIQNELEKEAESCFEQPASQQQQQQEEEDDEDGDSCFLVGREEEDPGDGDEDDWLLEMSALQLFQACLNGQSLDHVQSLVRGAAATGSSRMKLISFVGGNGRTCLHEAVVHCSPAVVQFLLSCFCDTNQASWPMIDDQGNTPLHLCAQATADHPRVPLHAAQSAAHLIAAAAAGAADVGLLNLRNAHGQTALMLACASDCPVLVTLLLQHHRDQKQDQDDDASAAAVVVTGVDAGGRTALHHCAAASRSMDGGPVSRRTTTCALLLVHGAQPSTVDAAGARPVDLLPGRRPNKTTADPADADAQTCRRLLQTWSRSLSPAAPFALKSLSVCRCLLASGQSPFHRLPWPLLLRILGPLLLPSPLLRTPYPLSCDPAFSLPPLSHRLFGPGHLRAISEYAKQRSTLPQPDDDTSPQALSKKLLSLH